MPYSEPISIDPKDRKENSAYVAVYVLYVCCAPCKSVLQVRVDIEARTSTDANGTAGTARASATTSGPPMSDPSTYALCPFQKPVARRLADVMAWQRDYGDAAHTLNPKPQALNPKPSTLNPKPRTLNPKP